MMVEYLNIKDLELRNHEGRKKGWNFGVEGKMGELEWVQGLKEEMGLYS